MMSLEIYVMSSMIIIVNEQYSYLNDINITIGAWIRDSFL